MATKQEWWCHKAGEADLDFLIWPRAAVARLQCIFKTYLVQQKSALLGSNGRCTSIGSTFAHRFRAIGTVMRCTSQQERKHQANETTTLCARCPYNAQSIQCHVIAKKARKGNQWKSWKASEDEQCTKGSRPAHSVEEIFCTISIKLGTHAVLAFNFQ